MSELFMLFGVLTGLAFIGYCIFGKSAPKGCVVATKPKRPDPRKYTSYDIPDDI